MANRYRGAMYVGVTTNLPLRIMSHRTGRGSQHCREHRLDRLVWAESMPSVAEAIAHEKRMKRWLRPWKFELIEKGNPAWQDLSGHLF